MKLLFPRPDGEVTPDKSLVGAISPSALAGRRFADVDSLQAFFANRFGYTVGLRDGTAFVGNNCVAYQSRKGGQWVMSSQGVEFICGGSD